MMFLHSHPYLSRILAHQDVFTELTYEDAKVSENYAHEDWHFNCEALAAGYDFVTAPRTILFYRKRKDSRSSAADRQSVSEIRPSRLFIPSVYRNTCNYYMQLLCASGAELAERPALPADAPADA